MKALIFFSLVSLTLSEITDSHLDNKYDQHYSQHSTSVSQARRGAAERMAKIEENSGQASGLNQIHYSSGHSSGGSERYVAGCTSCSNLQGYRRGGAYDSRSSSSRTGATDLSSSDYVGVGVVGHSGDVGLPYGSSGALNSGSSSSSMKYKDRSYEADDMQRQVPVNYPTSQYVSRQSSAHRAESTNSETGAPYVRITPVYRDSSSSAHLNQGSDTSNIYYSPTTGRQTVYVRPGSTIAYRVPVRVVPANNEASSISRSEYAESGSTRVQPGSQYTTVYRPVYEESSSSSRAENQSEYRTVPGSRTVYYPSVQQVVVPEKLVSTQDNRPENTIRNYGTYRAPETSSHTRQHSDSSQSQSQHRYVAAVNTPSNGGTSRYSTTGGTYSTRYIPSSSSVSKSELDEDDSDSVQTRIPASSSSGSSYGSRTHDNRQYGTTYVVPSSSSSRYHSSSDLDSRTRQHSTGRTQYGDTYGSSAGNTYDNTYGSRSSSRTGSSVFDTNTDLNAYMSESERLARLQSQSVTSSTGSSSSRHNHNSASSIDEINRRTLQQAENLDTASANFVDSHNNRLNLDNLDTDSMGTGTGGYKRIKSWSKQSKWASGSQYGQDGQPKSYSMLSTAEAEKHNINGAETGYKAATTTLENDGKVSTYSIHTP